MNRRLVCDVPCLVRVDPSSGRSGLLPGRGGSWLAVIASLVVIQLLPASAVADEVHMRDGSVLNGRIVRMEQDELYLRTGFTDDPIEILVWEIAFVTTDDPVDVLTLSGETLRGAITADDGQMMLQPREGDPVPLNWGTVAAIFSVVSPWTADFTFGGSIIEGNADVLGLTGSLDAARETGASRVDLSARFSRTVVNDREEARSASGSVGFDHFFRERLYAHVVEELYYNPFRDLDIRSVTSAGVGWVLHQAPATSLRAEAGLGLLLERFEREPDAERAALRGAASWVTPVGQRASFTNDFVGYFSFGDEELQLVNTATFEVELTGDWGLELENVVHHDTEPSFIAEGSDVEFTFGVSYSF